jgi:hypothetical protein
LLGKPQRLEERKRMEKYGIEKLGDGKNERGDGRSGLRVFVTLW